MARKNPIHVTLGLTQTLYTDSLTKLLTGTASEMLFRGDMTLAPGGTISMRKTTANGSDVAVTSAAYHSYGAIDLNQIYLKSATGSDDFVTLVGENPGEHV